MDTAPRVIANVGHSVYRFLRTYAYNGAVPGGTLLQQFSQLTILPAYPQDLTRITGPQLAVGTASEIGAVEQYYGERAQDQVILLDLYGFVAGQGSEHSNALYLSRLMNDVFWLFDFVVRHEGLPLLEHGTPASEIGRLEVDQVRARQIPETVPAVEADRFKFVVELELPYSAEA